jgi:hypothetical protein
VEDFEALCKQAQLTFTVPIVTRPRPPGTPMPASLIAEVKDKATPKTAKGATTKERENTALQQQHSELDSGETTHGLLRRKTYEDTSSLCLFR